MEEKPWCIKKQIKVYIKIKKQNVYSHLEIYKMHK